MRADAIAHQVESQMNTLVEDESPSIQSTKTHVGPSDGIVISSITDHAVIFETNVEDFVHGQTHVEVDANNILHVSGMRVEDRSDAKAPHLRTTAHHLVQLPVPPGSGDYSTRYPDSSSNLALDQKEKDTQMSQALTSQQVSNFAVVPGEGHVHRFIPLPDPGTLNIAKMTVSPGKDILRITVPRKHTPASRTSLDSMQ